MHSTSSKQFSRREFIGCSALALATATTLSGAEPPTPARFKIIGFIKPFQKLPFDEIANIAREVGWDGIECPVRKGGAIEPERVEEELPKLTEALRSRKLEMSVICTDVENATDPLAQKVLKTASKLGIQRYRLKHYYYDLAKLIPPQLEIFRARLRGLAQLNKELSLQGSVQNHSGKNYVGAPVWDLWELIRELDPRFMGVFFDIGHATIEGGYSWPVQAKLMETFFSVVSVKDFKWAKGDKGWRAEWCPLGEGMISRQFFDTLKKSSFNGPITQQFEYPLGTGRELVAALKKDLAVLRNWIGTEK
ncbi:MAG TPA: sugar phosphate isomerase/epimerase family protein [Candidatus Limnocylindria bacterium]|nr:sugar phosphate isomerase/epimerase family protein [Candidatus Limnocylindria bacterium]